MVRFTSVSEAILRAALGEHRSNAVGGFVRDYGVHGLVLVEFHETSVVPAKAGTQGGRSGKNDKRLCVYILTMADAILREKRKWRRAWKLELIERDNPQWRDLWGELA
jgi:putative endonuclease